MRPTKNLRQLQYAASKRLERIQGFLIRKSSVKATFSQESQIGFATIEILNTWVNFSRAYYLSANYSTSSTTGSKINVATRCLNENQAIGRAISHWKPRARPSSTGGWRRRDEPPWHDTSLFVDICRHEGFTNLADIEAAFSTGERTFIDLPVFRNYFAHRNRGSELAAKNLAANYGIAVTLRPSEILLSRPLGRPQALILDWTANIIFTIEYLCN